MTKVSRRHYDDLKACSCFTYQYTGNGQGSFLTRGAASCPLYPNYRTLNQAWGDPYDGDAGIHYRSHYVMEHT